MSDINIGQITEALNDKTDRDMRNVDTTAKADAVIDYQEPTSENGYTWYRKYASGWVEQGGKKGTTAVWSTITLPIPMADTNYVVVTTTQYKNSTNQYSSQVYNQTTTSFDTLQDYPTCWQVSGIAAS